MLLVPYINHYHQPPIWTLSLLIMLMRMHIHHAIPSIDLDVTGYPLDFQLVSANGCSGHYWFEGQWLGGQRKYTNANRTIHHSQEWDTWGCYNTSGQSLSVDCTNTNLFNCTQEQRNADNGMRVEYAVIANLSDGWYSLIQSDVYKRDGTHGDRYIYQDTEDNQWKISDSIGGVTTYATCNETNFFACDFVTTGGNSTPTLPAMETFLSFSTITDTHQSFCESRSSDYISIQCANDRTYFSVEGTYYMDIYPRTDIDTTFDLNIRMNTSNQTQIDVLIKPYDYHCKNSTFSIDYYDDQRITVYSNNSLITKCNNTAITPGDCPQWQTCIAHSKIGTIDLNSVHTMGLSLTSRVDTRDIQCNLRNLSIDLALSIQCHYNYDEINRVNTISCLNGTHCRNKTIECPRYGDCLINCITPRSCSSVNCSTCYQSIFLCPDSGNCAITCQGHHSCANTIFYGVTADVSCVGSHACAFSEFYYNSRDDNNDVLCEGENACFAARFDGIHSGDVECSGVSSCSYAYFAPDIEASLNAFCRNTSCFHVTFRCSSPKVACNVTCASDGCRHSNFYVYLTATYLTISNPDRSEIISYESSHAATYRYAHPILEVSYVYDGDIIRDIDRYLRMKPVNISSDICTANCTIWVLGPTKDILPIWFFSEPLVSDVSTDSTDSTDSTELTEEDIFVLVAIISFVVALFIIIMAIMAPVCCEGERLLSASLYSFVTFHILCNISILCWGVLAAVLVILEGHELSSARIFFFVIVCCLCKLIKTRVLFLFSVYDRPSPPRCCGPMRIFSVFAEHHKMLLLFKLESSEIPILNKDLKLFGVSGQNEIHTHTEAHTRIAIILIIFFEFVDIIFRLCSIGDSAFLCYDYVTTSFVAISVIWCVAISIICDIVHLWICAKYALDVMTNQFNHIQIEIKLHLFGHDENEKYNSFRWRPRPWYPRGELNDVIQSNLDSTIIDVFKYTQAENEVSMLVSVEWNSDASDWYCGPCHEHKKSKREMQNYLEDVLGDFRFAMHLKNYLNQFQTVPLKMITIDIKGDVSPEEMRVYMVNKLYEGVLRKCEYTIAEPVSLRHMDHKYITDLVSYCMLNDDKYKLHSTEIIRIIRESHIHGLAIAEQIKHGRDIEQYLHNFIGDYLNSDILNKIATNIKQKDIDEFSKLSTGGIFKRICMFGVDNFKHQWDSKKHIDGEWIIQNISNDLFVDELQSVTGLDRDDCLQIHSFILQYYVKSSDDEIRQRAEQRLTNSNVKTGENKMDYGQLAVKLKNKITIHQESAILVNLIDDLHQTNSILMELAKMFCDLCLDEWWCSECLYHNRIIKIHGKMLTPNDDLMQNCIVCGCKKVISIFNTLKGESKSNVVSPKIVSQPEMNDDIQCKLYDKTDIQSCVHYRRMIAFLHSEKEVLDYVDVLSNLTHEELIKNILCPSIDHISIYKSNDDGNTLRALFMNDCDEKEPLFDDGQSILRMTQTTLHDIMTNYDGDDHPSTWCIPAIYNGILKATDVFISEKERDLVGASYAEIVLAWDHLMQYHDIHEIFGDEFVCNDTNCSSTSRRRRTRRRSMLENRTFAQDCAFSEHAKQQILIYDHYKHDLAAIHYALLHKDRSRTQVKSIQSDDCDDDDENDIKEEQHSIYTLDEAEETNKVIIPNDTMSRVQSLSDDDVKDEPMEDESRYKTNIGLYGFGVDHQHHNLGPHENNTCFKMELNNNELWDYMLLKAMGKLRCIMHNTRYRSRQFSEDYNIRRGDPMGLHHILSICFYTDCSNLCREYRETYRRIEGDKNQDDIRIRHGKYYFLSRFLFESIEFFGDVMRANDVVYHGLDRQLLFSNFSTHFNAPMSTTPDASVVQRFANGSGIILTLRNGSTNVSNQYNIALFEANQPRYLQVNWISAFAEEKEWLFFGTATLFEVLNIEYVADRTGTQIPKHTLKQLNLLQQLIKGKMLEWNAIPKRVKKLATRLCVVRALNMELLRFNHAADHIDYLWNYLENNVDTRFRSSLYQWFEMNEYDAESLEQDIDDSGDKQQSNLYMFLIRNGYGSQSEKYFDIIYHLLREHQQMQIEQQDAPYWKKLFQYFIVSQKEFICIRQPFGIPMQLQNELFRDNKVISFVKLTDLFYNVRSIAFDHLSLVTMARNCSMFCRSIISYTDQHEQNKAKKLNFVEFKTNHLNNSKQSALLRKCAQKYDKISPNVDIKYIFQYEQQYILRFSINIQ